MDLFEIVHHAVHQPLAVYLNFTAERETVQTKSRVYSKVPG